MNMHIIERVTDDELSGANGGINAAPAVVLNIAHLPAINLGTSIPALKTTILLGIVSVFNSVGLPSSLSSAVNPTS